MRVRAVLGMVLGMVLSIVLVGAVGCVQKPPAEKPSRRVLLIGIDGATLRVIDPLVRQGRLPHLAAIAREGASGALRSHYPLLSPRVWNSIATGKTPKKHGIGSWTRDDGEGGRELMQSSDRKTHALWNIASNAGYTVGTVNWLNTYPIEIVDGIVVSDAAIPGEVRNREMFFARKDAADAADAPKEGTTFPPGWHERVTELRKGPRLFPDWVNPFEGDVDFPAWAFRGLLSTAFSNDEIIARIALAVEDEISPDLLMVLMPGIDKISHFLWAAMEPASVYPDDLQLTVTQRETSRSALLATYIQADRLIGELAARFGPDDLVMVVSDHGFEARVIDKHKTTGGHDTANALYGVMFARGAGIAPGELVRGVSVNDVTPTILAWWDMAVGEDMDGVPANFLGVEHPATIATYDTSPIKRAAAVPGASEDAVLEQLRALGYLQDETDG